MKFMDNINRIQAALTELRREIRQSEAPKCICPPKTVYPYGGDCPVHGRLTWPKTAGEYRGPKHEVIPPMQMDYAGKVGECTCNLKGVKKDELLAAMIKACPVHGTTADDILTDYFSSVAREAREKFEASLTPDLPLHVRVAQALGHACWTDRDGIWRSHLGRFIPNGVKYPLVPDYPNDLVAAMGALEEYCGEHHCFLNIYGGSDRSWEVQVFDKDTHVAKVSKLSTSFADAICLAIVAHSEGK